MNLISNLLTLLDYGQHIVYVGKTGSGKSYLAEHLLRYYQRYLIIDTQDIFDYPDAVIVQSPHTLHTELVNRTPKIIYKPALKYRNKIAWDYIFSSLDQTSYKKDKNHRIVYIDEIYHLGYGQSFPQKLSQGITTARQKGISYWVSTQRPTAIPVPILTEARKIYVFALNSKNDKKRIAEFSPDSKLYIDLEGMPADHSFYEIDNHASRIIKHAPAKFNF